VPIDYVISDKSSRFMKPANGAGFIDVVKDFSWTLSPTFPRKDVPYIELIEYQQTAGKIIASILYFARVLPGLIQNPSQLISGPKDPADVFQLKYIAEPTGFSYRFPYFDTKRVSRNTEFSYEDGKNPFSELLSFGHTVPGLSNKIGGASTFTAMVGAAMQVGSGIVPGKLSLDNPRQWTGTNDSGYIITFDLFNSATVQDITQNVKLVELLTYQQSPFRRGVAIVDPTCIYSVNIPGVVNLPAAFMNSLEVTDLGNKRMMNINGVNKVIPEAFRITMNIQSLFLPYRNILEKVYSGKTVQAIANIDWSNPDALLELIKIQDININND